MAVTTVERLTSLYAGIARALGATGQEAAVFARCLVRADLRGMYTQGAAVVPYLVWMIEQRLMNFGAPFTVLREEAGWALVDGGRGVGSVVSTRAMELAIAKAKSAGTGSVWVRNGGDFAMASNHALQALEHDQVGVAMRNCSTRVAPWGGRTAFFGTNPLSVAIPTDNEPPIVIDMASGSFSVGQVVMAARDKRRLPSQHLVDSSGRYTDDPLAIIVDPLNRESDFTGAIVTQGYKGMAWSLIVELFAGLLSGMGASYQNDYEQGAQSPWNEGIFLMAVDVARLRPVEEFKAAADDLARALRSVPPAKGFERVIVPGELEAERERKYGIEGVPVRDEDWEGVLKIAARLGVERKS
jgi:LDH2 family malate/lactate/ureidoglycolate dehydrogenase